VPGVKVSTVTRSSYATWALKNEKQKEIKKKVHKNVKDDLINL